MEVVFALLAYVFSFFSLEAATIFKVNFPFKACQLNSLKWTFVLASSVFNGATVRLPVVKTARSGYSSSRLEAYAAQILQ